MSGAPSGVTVGAAVVGTGVAAGKGAQALLPFTGLAVGIYVVLAVALLIAGLILRHVGTKRS